MSLLLLLAGSSGGGVAPPPSDPPVYESYSSVFANNTLPKPTGTEEGDLLILSVYQWHWNDTTPTAPDGFEQIGSEINGKLSIYRKRAGASEPANYTTSFGNIFISTMTRISGANAVAPINAFASASSHVSPSVDTTSDKCLILSFMGSADYEQTHVAPSELTARYNIGVYQYGEDQWDWRLNSSLGTVEKEEAGATGTYTWARFQGFTASMTIAIAP
jgi:hypothetical protein